MLVCDEYVNIECEEVVESVSEYDELCVSESDLENAIVMSNNEDYRRTLMNELKEVRRMMKELE